MARFILFLFFVSSMTPVIGQSLQDMRTVIQMSIDHEELQPHLDEDKAQGRTPLIIFNDETIRDDLELMKFGAPVKFKEKKDLFFHDETAHLDFDVVSVLENQAEIQFTYLRKDLTFSLNFKKENGRWTIESSEIK